MCMEMNLQTLFQDFNPSKFVVHTCLLIFTALLALKLDKTITWSYWAVFTPIWIWKFLVILGATVGTYVWWQYPHFRLEGEAYIHYKAMLISLAIHLILLMFELLVCDQLSTSRHLWILVFIPLIFISIVSIAICIWSVKHDRSYELELFCAVNILQFIFLALKLDTFIHWSWEVVFVPLWILMCLSLVGEWVLYSIIFAGILLRTPEVNVQQRRTSFNTALAYTFTVIPILVFQVLLTNKLDNRDELSSFSYIVVVSPLFVSYATLIVMSFSSKGGNKWWFGIRKDFCQFLLSVFPLLQEYANIAYNNNVNRSSMRSEVTQEPYRDEETNKKVKDKKSQKNQKKNEAMKPVVPVTSIDMPD
ncbi:PREDICTED: transmembrane protein 185B isoform X1 [Papilio polytes]|uniref:transmembrane protein 185B isoform X1 n=1 Tax=Papilio polytes TaxID=76194 RepID=UPI000676AD20|nr:PREDICTED: transmembrane protein 185B isoform X1 [Papilio polytes]